MKLDQVQHRKILESSRRLGQMFQNSLRSDGRKRFVESVKSVAEANAGKLGHKTKLRDNATVKQEDNKPADCIFGEDILKLSASEEKLYNVHFPIQHGTCFIHEKVYLGPKFV